VPLLPLTESLQPVEIEFAWVLLLTPMGAVFYLALTSVRLRQQTDQLQKTITELNATRLRETQLKSYAALITRAQEDERRRLARELHDDTAQALIALSRGLDALSNRHINPVSSPDDVRFLDQLVDLTQRTLDSVRRACQDLRPSVLDDLGLSAALESLAGAMTERGMPCEYEEHGAAQPYPLEVEVAVYRIAQEALSNALRHSEPSQAQIELRYRPDGLRLIVSDDGHGFDVSATLAGAPGGASRSTAENGSGLGLMGMRERATLIGATLDIQSAPGAGTRITLEAPASAPLTPLPDDPAQLQALTLPGAR
jgi:signal transduction histidine kinase